MDDFNEFIKLCNDITVDINKLDSNAIVDGIINIEKYYNLPKDKPKILWVMKEPNSNEKNWCYQDYLSVKEIEWKKGTEKDTLKYRFFVKLLNATYSILNGLANTNQLPKITEKEVYEIGESIAYINIKKTGGGSSSNYKIISNTYSVNEALLLKQISAYNPNIIIFGNTLGFFDKNKLKEIGWELLDENYRKPLKTSCYFVSPTKLCIHAFHPSYWIISNDSYCSEIIEIVKLWNENKV